MTSSAFSIFGFDLFGLARRTSGKRADSSKIVEKPQSRTEKAEREVYEVHPEIFLWGMYPVY